MEVDGTGSTDQPRIDCVPVGPGKLKISDIKENSSRSVAAAYSSRKITYILSDEIVYECNATEDGSYTGSKFDFFLGITQLP